MIHIGKYFSKLSILLFILIINNVKAQDLTHFSENKSSVNGSVSASAIFYGANGITNRKVPFSYILGGNFNINLKGFVLPFSFTYSDRNSDFRQPFNHFGLSPQYKWAKLHLGYRNVSFSRYILSGHTIFGVGLELNPKNFRFGVVYGRLQRKTNRAVSVYNPVSDTISAFTRKVFSLKIGVGSKKTFFDVIFLRAYDDPLSLDSVVNRAGKFPAANLVGGINTRIKFTKTLHFEAEGAYSIYTNDVNANEISFSHSDQIAKFIPVNISTQGLMALRSSFVYKSAKGLTFGLNYSRIDPGYKSMGIYFVNNDLENMTLSTGFQLLKRKLRFRGSLGLERNNLKVSRNATTKKMIGSANFTYDPVRFFGIGINYSNYSINQSAGRMQIADSVKVYQTNANMMVMPHFQFMGKGKNANHFINLIYTRMGLNDKNPYTDKYTSFTSTNIMVNYSLSYRKIGLSFNLSAVYNQINMVASKSTNKTAVVGISKTMLKNKINFSFNSSITKSENNTEKFLVFTPSVNGRLKLGKHHSFNMKLYLITNNNQTDKPKSYNERTGDFSYVFTF